MARYDDDAVWLYVETGELDEEGDPCGDYVLSGSLPLSPWEAMVLAAAGVAPLTDLWAQISD